MVVWSRVMAKWGSQGLDDGASVRQRLAELSRASSDQSASRSGLSLSNEKSDLDTIVEGGPPILSVELPMAHMASSHSPFASASDLSGYEVIH